MSPPLPSLSRQRCQDIAASRLFLVFADEHYGTDPDCQASLAYALQLGKPIRVLLLPGVRLPEYAFLGVTDVQIVRSRGQQADAAQIARWIEEAKEKE